MYFLYKRLLRCSLKIQGGPCEEDYDSDNSEYSELESEEEEDVFADTTTEPKTSAFTRRKDNTEHSNPNSYSWTILRAATVKLIQNKLQEYISIAGIELQGGIVYNFV